MRPVFRLLLAAWWALATPLANAGTEPTPPALLLAGTAADRIDPAPYWVSEKYDGVRAIWDGTVLRFRSGRPVPAPAWFTAGLPAEPLDGELWLGRRRFDELSGIVRKQIPIDAEWQRVRYLIFELPGAPGTFSDRIEAIRRIVAAADRPWLQAVEQFRLADRRALRERFDAVIAAGGEGLMLHRADAPYVTGRSDVLLKLKPWLDAEARVVGHVPGKGRYQGRLGALRVEAPDGRRFRIGTGFSDAARRQPPAVGTIVTYRYRQLTADGKPRHAAFVRVREDF